MGAARAALQYHPEAFDSAAPQLMGRIAASEAMLRAWILHADANPVTCWTWQPAHGEAFSRQIAAWGKKARVVRCGPDDHAALIDAGALWLPGPDLGGAAWARGRVGDRTWSIVGITHTTASHLVMDHIAGLLTAPVQPWDALICTSRAVKATVEHVLEREADHLRRRLDAKRFIRPELPVIPLGVHSADFEATEARRTAARTKFAIPKDAIAILQFGRLAFHAKAHPVPLFMAIEEAARRSKAKLHLLLAGWFANDGQAALFRGWAAEFAPSVNVQFVDGRVAALRRDVFAASDIFTLLADNVQETFGLAPVEAMAAGLPVVVSDWDGFKDTVEHGVHGYRIPAFQPPIGAGGPIADGYADMVEGYDSYIGSASQSIAVDIPKAADALHSLIVDRDLRRRMGTAGREHVRRHLDWSVIIGRYRELLTELEARRSLISSDGQSDFVGRAPARDDPFALFAAYPTDALSEGMELVATPRGTDPTLETLLAHSGIAARPKILPEANAMSAIVARCATPCTIREILSGSDEKERDRLLRGIGWLLKFSLIQVTSAPTPPLGLNL